MDYNMTDHNKPAAHGGNIRELAEKRGVSPDTIIDYSANINPLGPPAWLDDCIREVIPDIVHYPDRSNKYLVRAIAETYGISEERIVVGNGTTELLFTVPRVVNAEKALVPVPSYGDYGYAVRRAGTEVIEMVLREDDRFILNCGELEKVLETNGFKKNGGGLVLIGQPNNPTGLLVDGPSLTETIRRFPRTFFCIDEAFADFVEDYSDLVSVELPNLLVFRSFTKFYAIPGLRLGWAACPAETAQALRVSLPSWSVNVFAQEVGRRACFDLEYAAATRRYVGASRKKLYDALTRFEQLTVYPGTANYLFVRIDAPETTAEKLFRFLLTKNIAIRLCRTYRGLDDRFFRLAVRTNEENDMIVKQIARFFESVPERGQ